MLKKIDRYLLSSYFSSLLVVVVSIGLIIIVINAVEQLRDFIDHQVPLLTIAEYYLYFGGWVLKSFTPVFVLLATLFSVSMLARRRELLAMKTSGISLYRLLLPYLVVTILIATGHFYYNEYLYPDANRRRLEIKEFTIKQRPQQRLTHVANVYRQIRPGFFYTIGSLNVSRGEGKDLKVYHTENNRLQSILTAAQVMFKDHQWVAINGVVRSFDTTGEAFTEFKEYLLPDIQDRPDDFAKPIGKPEDMGYDDLKAYIDLMRRTGGPYLQESIDLDIKLSFPLTSIIVVLVSVPFASSPRRGGIAISIAAGALISLAYFVLFKILQSAGYNERVPKDVAVWGVNGLFFLIGIVSILFSKK